MRERMQEGMRERILSHVICLSQSEAQESAPASAPICHVICLSQSEAQESPLVSTLTSAPICDG